MMTSAAMCLLERRGEQPIYEIALVIFGKRPYHGDGVDAVVVLRFVLICRECRYP